MNSANALSIDSPLSKRIKEDLLQVEKRITEPWLQSLPWTQTFVDIKPNQGVWITRDSRSQRLQLFLGGFRQKMPYSVLISEDRNLIWPIDLVAPDIAFNGTLFDGDLGWDNNIQKHVFKIVVSVDSVRNISAWMKNVELVDRRLKLSIAPAKHNPQACLEPTEHLVLLDPQRHRGLVKYYSCHSLIPLKLAVQGGKILLSTELRHLPKLCYESACSINSNFSAIALFLYSQENKCLKWCQVYPGLVTTSLQTIQQVIK